MEPMGEGAVASTKAHEPISRAKKNRNVTVPTQRRYSTRLLEWSKRQFDSARIAAGHADDRSQWH